MATILITGANRGIGLELSKQYAAAGETVIRCMRGADKADGALGRVLPLDVSDDASVSALAEALGGEAIDLLINNAGVIGPEPSKQSGAAMDIGAFLNTLDINVAGPLRVTQALLPNLRAAKAGKVAVVSSQMGQMTTEAGKHGYIAYRTSKAAVNKVFQCLATELKPDGIAVAMLHPGWVRTEMGGSGADISVEESAGGIRSVLGKLDLESSGGFWAYDGKVMAW